MQIQLTGFLESKAGVFVERLWKLLLSAQTSIAGIPQEILEKKKLEIIEKRKEEDKIKELIRTKQAEVTLLFFICLFLMFRIRRVHGIFQMKRMMMFMQGGFRNLIG